MDTYGVRPYAGTAQTPGSGAATLELGSPPASPGIGMATLPQQPQFAPPQQPLINPQQNPFGAAGLVLSNTAAGISGGPSPVDAMQKHNLAVQEMQARTGELTMRYAETFAPILAKSDPSQWEAILQHGTQTSGGLNFAPLAKALATQSVAARKQFFAAIEPALKDNPAALNAVTAILAAGGSPEEAAKFAATQLVKPTTAEKAAEAGAVETAQQKAKIDNPIPQTEQIDLGGTKQLVDKATGKTIKSFGVTAKPTEANAPVSASADEITSIGAQAKTGMPLTQIVPGYGAKAVNLRQQARSEAIKQIQTETGMSAAEAGTELANRTIEFQSGKRSGAQLTTMLGATKQAVAQLDFNIEKTKEEMGKLPSSDISPVLNALVRGEEKWTGNPAYSSLFYYMHATALESARILAGGQASIAQLQAGAREEAQKWAGVNMTPSSFGAVAKAMHDEGSNRLDTFEQAIKSQRVGGSGPGGTGAVAGTLKYNPATGKVE